MTKKNEHKSMVDLQVFAHQFVQEMREELDYFFQDENYTHILRDHMLHMIGDRMDSVIAQFKGSDKK